VQREGICRVVCGARGRSDGRVARVGNGLFTISREWGGLISSKWKPAEH
jgi:hypothetical protein